MRHFVDSLRSSLAHQDWYGALTLAVTLPDICGRLQDPGVKSEARTVKWFTTYVEPCYRGHVVDTGEQFVAISGQDFYALRCAFLHEGDTDITKQSARRKLERFEFITPDGPSLHLTMLEGVIVLRVDLFCESICEGVEAWLAAVAQLPDVQKRIGELPTIRTVGTGRFAIEGRGAFYFRDPKAT